MNFTTTANNTVNLQDTEAYRNAVVKAYIKRYQTKAIRQQMRFFGITQAEYRRQIKALLFPYPIVNYSASTSTAKSVLVVLHSNATTSPTTLLQ